jgi:flagellin
MPISVNTNVNALLAQQYLTENQQGLAKAMQRLSSGLRINEAADDPAGLAIVTSMTTSASALRQASRNANDGISLIQTAQGAMSNINNLLTQMTTLAVQGSSGTYSSTQLTDLNKNFTALLTEINRVASVTTFNGVALLNNSNTVTIQVGGGNTANDRLSITLANMTTGSTGLNISGLTVDTSANAQAALSALSGITAVTSALASFGANQVNLQAAYSSNNSTATNLESAKSRIADADFTVESSNLAKYNILNQSNVAMLAQANSTPQLVLQLLRG